jgi:hypothetical protein
MTDSLHEDPRRFVTTLINKVAIFIMVTTVYTAANICTFNILNLINNVTKFCLLAVAT